jgi:hypothetical protein
MRKLLLILLCLALVPAGFAQTLTSGDIIGTVLDPQGAVVPNAAVTARNIDTGATQTAKANAQGAYRFSELKPGRYELTVSATGFQPAKQTAVVAVGGTTNANIQLALQGATQTVEVTAETPVVSVTPNNTTTFDQIQIEQQPNPGQDLSWIAQTSPGATMNTQGGFGNFEVFGLPGTSNNFTINGGVENDPYLNLNNSGASNLLLGNNDISEATVVTNGYSGQYGHLAGAQVNYVSKSGGNNFHGNAKYWWNGRAMNANDWFANNNGQPRPFVNSNQWAASFGGPIRKDKTFFFVDYEGMHTVLPTANVTYVPTVAWENYVLGNLPSVGMGASVPFYQRIFNLYNNAPQISAATPVTSSDDPSFGCGDFAGTAGFGTAASPCARKFVAEVSNFTPEWLLTARVDHHIGTNDTAFLHFRTDHGKQPTFTDPINPQAFNATSTQPQYEGQLSETHVFGANTVNQAIVTGMWYSAIFNNNNRSLALQTFPTTIIWQDGLFANLGGENYAFPQGRNVSQGGLVDDFSWTHGRHTLKFGANFLKDAITDAIFGTVTSGEALPFSMTDFASGIMDFYTQRFPSQLEQRVRLWSLGLYAQDEFRVSNNVKLTLTLRGDHNSNPTCDRNCFANTTGSFQSLPAGTNVAYNSVIQPGLHSAFPNVQTILWQPRVGFTWNHWTNTVLSGGVGIFYDTPPATVLDRFARNSPQVNSFTDQNFSDPFSPAEAGNVFSVLSAANNAFSQQFASGGTFSSINTAVLAATGNLVGFTAPNYSIISGTAFVPQYQEWNLRLQQGVGNNMAFSLNYVGNHGIHIPIINGGLNARCTTANCGTAPSQVRNIFPTAIPNPSFGTVSVVNFGANSNYNGLTGSFQRRFTSGLSLTLNYTWSHALDEVSNGGLLGYTGDSILAQINPNCLRCNNYGNADYDIRHNISGNLVWNVPFKSMFHNHGPNVLLGGWTLASDVFWHTGFPYSVTTNLAGSIKNYGGTIFGMSLGGIPGNCSSPSTPCLTASQFASATTPITSFGNQERNQFRGPNFWDTNLTVNKNFGLPHWESGRLVVGANFYNVFNHPNFCNPNTSLNGGNFGTITCTVSTPTSFLGSFVGAAAAPRLIQLQAKIEF